MIVLLLGSVEVVLLGGHLLHAGLYTDDWPITSIQQQQGTWGLFTNLVSANHGRPLGALYLALTTRLSGPDPHLHALWGLLTLLTAASTVCLLLRALSLRLREALAVVLLFLVFPFADSGWLWYSASHAYLAVTLAALGGTLALAGLQREGRAAVAFHAGALVLFAASILTYQIAAGVICLSVLAYRSRVPRRLAVILWLSDVVVVALASALPTLLTGSAGSTAVPLVSVAEAVHHARLLADQSQTLLTLAVVPFGSAHRNLVLPIAVSILVVGAVLARRYRAERVLCDQLRRAMVMSVVGGLVVAAAYAVYVPTPSSLYEPLGGGGDNRVNVLASLGYVCVVYGLATVVGVGALRLLRRPPRWVPAVSAAIVTIVFAGYVTRVNRDIAAWNRSGEIQRQELDELRAVGRPAQGTTVYAFGGIGTTAPGVFAFGLPWDLDGAIQLLWHDGTLHAYPIFADSRMTCTTKGVVPVGVRYGLGQAATYGHAVFYDFRTGHRRQIDDARACGLAIADFIPGPAEG